MKFVQLVDTEVFQAKSLTSCGSERKLSFNILENFFKENKLGRCESHP